MSYSERNWRAFHQTFLVPRTRTYFWTSRNVSSHSLWRMYNMRTVFFVSALLNTPKTGRSAQILLLDCIMNLPDWFTTAWLSIINLTVWIVCFYDYRFVIVLVLYIHTKTELVCIYTNRKYLNWSTFVWKMTILRKTHWRNRQIWPSHWRENLQGHRRRYILSSFSSIVGNLFENLRFNIKHIRDDIITWHFDRNYPDL